MSRKTIPTRYVGKGDLVPGHKVYLYFPGDIPMIPATVVETNKSGQQVTVKVKAAIAIVANIPQRIPYTWRRSKLTYQPKSDPTRDVVGILLDGRGSIDG